MPKKKPEEPIVVNPFEPFKKCYDCIHWHPNTEKRRDYAVDFSSGYCDHNGYSKCPPMSTCNGWCHNNVEMYNNIHETY